MIGFPLQYCVIWQTTQEESPCIHLSRRINTSPFPIRDQGSGEGLPMMCNMIQFRFKGQYQF
jgi:hypothetical protein